MKYYLHDTSAIEDEKVAELYKKFGYEGVGLFYVILEKLGKQEKPIKTDVLQFQLKVGKKLKRCWDFMEEIGLISSNDGETFNKQLLNFSKNYQIKKEKTREKVAEWREKQRDKESVTSYETVSNHPKVKESKEKESKDINIEFEEFWELYNKKVGNKGSCQKKWNKLSDNDRDQIIKTLPLFLKSISDKQYQPYPETYLNQKRWNDEIQKPVKDNDFPIMYR